MITRNQIEIAIRKIGVRTRLIFLWLLANSRKAASGVKLLSLQMLAAYQRTGKHAKLIFLATLLLLFSTLWANHLYRIYLGPNVTNSVMLYIHDEDNFDRVVSLLKEKGSLQEMESFKSLAHFKDYDKNIRPGAYKIQAGWSNNKLINVLRSGAQTPVMVTFNSIRTREDLAGKLSRQLQSDSLSFLKFFRNDSLLFKMGIKPEILPALLIPNSYSLYWTTTPSGFLARMKHEYDLFWSEARKLKAKNAGLTPEQVSTLASIVQEESNKNDEKPIIAGVYLNRLKKSWFLQADPTIRFALGDFTIKRVLKAQLTVVSPYNTYTKTGLPPGPINFPEISSLEAVLNFGVHDYFYFCAKEDFSGYHNFAKTLAEHNRNAQKYQAALNKMKIYK